MCLLVAAGQLEPLLVHLRELHKLTEQADIEAVQRREAAAAMERYASSSGAVRRPRRTDRPRACVPQSAPGRRVHAAEDELAALRRELQEAQEALGASE